MSNLGQAIRDIGARIPSELKQLRGKLMLEPVAERLGVEEVRCPACAGSGWLDRKNLEECPLCNGFVEVPDRLADWFKVQMCRAGGRRAPGAARGRAASPMRARERHGRLGEVLYRVHAPVEP